MTIPNEIVERVLNEVVERFLKPKFIELKMNSMGGWLNSLEVRGNEIWGMDYTEQLVFGRKPGKLPPVEPLIQWVIAKFGRDYNSAEPIAYAIAHKISKEGTDYYPGGTDLMEVLESEEVRDFVLKEISQYVIKEVNNFISKEISQYILRGAKQTFTR